MRHSLLNPSLVLVVLVVLFLATSTAHAIVSEIDSFDYSGLQPPEGQTVRVVDNVGTNVESDYLYVPAGTLTATEGATPISGTVYFSTQGLYRVWINMSNDDPLDRVDVTIGTDTYGVTTAEGGCAAGQWCKVPLSTGLLFDLESTISVVIDPNTGSGSTVRLDCLLFDKVQPSPIVELDEINWLGFNWLAGFAKEDDYPADYTTNQKVIYVHDNEPGVIQGLVALEKGHYDMAIRMNNNYAYPVIVTIANQVYEGSDTEGSKVEFTSVPLGLINVDIPGTNRYDVSVNLPLTWAGIPVRLDSIILTKVQKPTYLEIDELNWYGLRYIGSNSVKVEHWPFGPLSNDYYLYIAEDAGQGGVITGKAELFEGTYDLSIHMNNAAETDQITVTIAGTELTASLVGVERDQYDWGWASLGELEVAQDDKYDIVIDPGFNPHAGILRFDSIKADTPVQLSKCDPDWLPTYDPDAQDTVEFTATILPDDTTGTFEFNLPNASKEKGYCTNAGSQTDRDLKFVPAADQIGGEAAWTVPENGQKATTKDPAASATVRVYSLDYGAYGKIKASADIAGKTYPAITVDGKGFFASIPLDEDADRIADKWEKDVTDPDDLTALSTDTDEDDSWGVVKHTLKGDGLTAYEEYRGFLVQGVHYRTNELPDDTPDAPPERKGGPFVKDVFIHDPPTQHPDPEEEEDVFLFADYGQPAAGFGLVFHRIHENEMYLNAPEPLNATQACSGDISQVTLPLPGHINFNGDDDQYALLLINMELDPFATGLKGNSGSRFSPGAGLSLNDGYPVAIDLQEIYDEIKNKEFFSGTEATFTESARHTVPHEIGHKLSLQHPRIVPPGQHPYNSIWSRKGSYTIIGEDDLVPEDSFFALVDSDPAAPVKVESLTMRVLGRWFKYLPTGETFPEYLEIPNHLLFIYPSGDPDPFSTSMDFCVSPEPKGIPADPDSDLHNLHVRFFLQEQVPAAILEKVQAQELRPYIKTFGYSQKLMDGRADLLQIQLDLAEWDKPRILVKDP